MQTIRPKILAIDPGTKEIGVAVLDGAELCYYGVKTIKRRQPPHALLAEISSCIEMLIQDHSPEILAIEQTPPVQQNSALLAVAAAQIKQVARQNGLSIYERLPAEVRKAICLGDKATKRETARRVAERFPELTYRLERPTRWEELYWANMFDAVAIGLVCLRDVHQETGRGPEGAI